MEIVDSMNDVSSCQKLNCLMESKNLDSVLYTHMSLIGSWFTVMSTHACKKH